MLGQPESHHVLQHSQVLGHTLVTASGHEVMTSLAPKEVTEIEAVMAKKGLT
jgi:hypothetical protein